MLNFDLANPADLLAAKMYLLAQWGEEYNAGLRFEMLYLGLDY
jgi:hypothetical protein